MTANQAQKLITDSLAARYSSAEAGAIAKRLLEDKFLLSPLDIILRGDMIDVDDKELTLSLERLKTGEPIQYVVGFEDFCGLRLQLSDATLIPRPETEMLVNLIVTKVDKSRRIEILDIGTGSGAIAIALAAKLPLASVSALDISTQALEIARKNAATHNLNITFINADILTYTSAHKYDIIVSNPPYVTQSEQQFMQANVLDHEPHTALFVPDSDPLRFYTTITKFAVSNLNKGGEIFFEINESFARETAQLLENNHFTNVEIHNDFNDKPRIVCARN